MIMIRIRIRMMMLAPLPCNAKPLARPNMICHCSHHFCILNEAKNPETHSRPAGSTSTSSTPVAISKFGTLPWASNVTFQTRCSSCSASWSLIKSTTLLNMHRTCCPAAVKLSWWSLWICSVESHVMERSCVSSLFNLHPKMCSLPLSAVWSTTRGLSCDNASSGGLEPKPTWWNAMKLLQGRAPRYPSWWNYGLWYLELTTTIFMGVINQLITGGGQKL